MKNLLLTLLFALGLFYNKSHGQSVEPFVEEFYGSKNKGMWFTGEDKNELCIIGERVASYSQLSENITFHIQYPRIFRYDLNNKNLVDSFVMTPLIEYIRFPLAHNYYFPGRASAPRNGIFFLDKDKTTLRTITTLQNSERPLLNHAFELDFNFNNKSLTQDYITIYDSVSPEGLMNHVSVNILQPISQKLAIANFWVGTRDHVFSDTRLVVYDIQKRTFKEIAHFKRHDNRSDIHRPLKIIPNKKDSSTFFLLLKRHNFARGETYHFLIKMDTMGNELWNTQLHQPYWDQDRFSHMMNDPVEYALQQRADGNLILSYINDARWNITLANRLGPESGRLSDLRDSNRVVLRLYSDETGERLRQKSIPGIYLRKVGGITDTSLSKVTGFSRDVPASIILKNGDFVMALAASNTNKFLLQIFSMRFDSNFSLKSVRVIHPFPERYSAGKEPWEYVYHDSYLELRSILEMDDGSLLYSGSLRYAAKTLGNEVIHRTRFSTFLMGTDEYGCMKPGCQERDTLIDYWEDRWETVQREEAQNLDFKLYPNPAQAIFYLELSQELHGKPLQLQVLNLQGQPIHTDNFTASGSRKSIASQNWAAGLYQVVLTTRAGEQLRKKLVVY